MYTLRPALFCMADLISVLASTMFSVVLTAIVSILSRSWSCSNIFSVNSSCNSAIRTALDSIFFTYNATG